MNPRVEWYEAGAAGVSQWTLSLESGAWTLSVSKRGVAVDRAGTISEPELAAIYFLAESVRPEDSPGGPDLSASGVQTLLVVACGGKIEVRGGEAETFPTAPEELILSVLANMPACPLRR